MKISFASKVRTPSPDRYGEDDTNVPLNQAIFFHRALNQFGAEHELVVYPQRGHGLTERNHQLDLLRRTRMGSTGGSVTRCSATAVLIVGTVENFLLLRGKKCMQEPQTRAARRDYQMQSDLRIRSYHHGGGAAAGLRQPP